MTNQGGVEGVNVMNVELSRRPGMTPESDCNSNNLPGDISLCSNSSMDFLQDNSDYQWFLECGDHSNVQKSILSGYYDELAKNLDANLAEVEMEDLQSHDMHSILSTLRNDLQGLEEREMFASVSGSMMVKFDFDSSISPHSNSQEVTTSMCRSGPLFSPLKQTSLPAANLSVDSLDLSDDMNLLITCQANKNNYTIAFEGSTVMESDSDLLDNERPSNEKVLMARSDSMYTTWSQLKQQSRGSSDNGNIINNNNNNNCEETGKSLSMPDLCGQQQRPSMVMSVSSKLSSETGSSDSEPRTTVKLYDIQNVNHKSSLSDSSASGIDKSGKPRNFSLVKLFMKQKGSNEAMEQSSSSECWRNNAEINEKADAQQGIPKSVPFNVNNNNSFGLNTPGVDKACQTDGKHPVYLVYPNYTLPDLNFIKEHHNVGNLDLSQMFLSGQKFRRPSRMPVKVSSARTRPVSMNDMESLRKKGFRHVQDWASLTFLLPKECKEFLEGIPEIVAQLKDVRKPLFNVGASGSSGYRGSSTMLTSNNSDEMPSKGLLRDSCSGKFTCKTAKDTANMRRLEELLEISSVFGDSSDEVTQEEIRKLRQQIGRFLNMQKELEKVSEKLSGNESICLDEACRKGSSFSTHRSSTPPNSPTINLQQQRSLQKKRTSLANAINEESENSSADHSIPPSFTDVVAQKKELIKDVIRATRTLIKTYEKGGDTATVCLQDFCPALYALMSDGLKEQLDTPFGPISNSVWAVVEASTGQVSMTRALNELVLRLNRELVLNEPLLKFNAFIFGLLNVHAIEGWLSYLRTQDGLLHKYYDSQGLFILANTMGLVRYMLDHVIDDLKPLSLLHLDLDLLHQAKILHRSLSNINNLLEATSTESLLSPSKQLMLLKLVQSLQKSNNEDSSDAKVERRRPGTSTSVQTRQNHPHLRPRSGCDITISSGASAAMRKRWSGVQLNSRLSRAFEQLGEDIESEGYTDSLDNGMAVGTSDRSPPAPPPPSNVASACKRLQMSDDTSEDVSSTWTGPSSPTRTSNNANFSREAKRNILSSLNKKIASPELNTSTTGRKFKRLQQRWEQLSGQPDSSISPLSSPEQKSPAHKQLPVKLIETDKNNCDNSCNNAFVNPISYKNAAVTTPSPTSRLSRIPRLVTSPVRPQSAPFPNAVPPKPSKPGLTEPIKRQTVTRPTTLPYRRITPTKEPPHSMSLNRRPASSSHASSSKQQPLRKAPKTVRTITHRLSHDSGHLSFNVGEKLKLVLEVDDTYLLCCSGSRKGLVPRSAVITLPDHVRV